MSKNNILGHFISYGKDIKCTLTLKSFGSKEENEVADFLVFSQ